MSFKNFCVRATLVSGAFLLASPAFAAVATGSFQVSANVASNCRVSSTGVAFGSYTGTALANTGNNIVVTCNRGVAITSLLIGDGANAAVAQKRMLGPTAGEYLNYNIDVPTGAALNTCPTAGTTEWNGTTGPTGAALTALFASSGGPRDISICGSVPVAQYPANGAYIDTITMTLTFN